MYFNVCAATRHRPSLDWSDGGDHGIDHQIGITQSCRIGNKDLRVVNYVRHMKLFVYEIFLNTKLY